MHGIESIEKKAQPPAVGPLPSPVEPDRQKRQQRPPRRGTRTVCPARESE